MATKKQTQANKKNALRSSGPKSSDGKQQSSINAQTHGLNQQMQALTNPEIIILQALFETDGLSADEALELAEAHSARSRVRVARHQAWSAVYHSHKMDPKIFGALYDASAEEIAKLDKEFNGKFWHRTAKNCFLKPFSSEQDRSDRVTMAFLDKQRRLNRYDVKAVSTLSKLYKKAYKT